MSDRRGEGIATIVGVALLATHIALMPTLVAAASRPALEVMRTGPLVVDGPSPVGSVAHGVSTVRSQSDDGPGVVWTRWTASYRGGIERSVGAYQLVGPFQDVEAPPCGGRMVLGQRLLDDGTAGEGTVAAIVVRELAESLAGMKHFTIGSFRQVTGVRLHWAQLLDYPGELGMFSSSALRAPRPTGYLRAEAILIFDRVRVPVTFGAILRIDGGMPQVIVGIRARLDFNNRILGWLNDRIGGNRLATRLASSQLDTRLLSALGPPPPLPLPGGRSIQFEPCPDQAVQVQRGLWAAVPLRWKLGGPVGPVGATNAAPIRPPRRAPVVFAMPSPDAAITIDFDLNGLNGLLYELWRIGWLDDVLDQIAVHERFNRDKTVATYLSLRLSPIRLALPPTLGPGADGRLRLALALAVNIADGSVVTPASAWGVLEVALGRAAGGDRLAADVGVSSLELTCEPTPGRLLPCYGDVVAGVRAAAAGTHAALGESLAETLSGIFIDQRVTAAGVPAALAITGVSAQTGGIGAVRLELAARVAR